MEATLKPRLFAPTVVLSAFLLFLAQPVAGKVLLPWFGGSAGVWATCLVFFQGQLLLGYLYSHWLVSGLRPKAQALSHAAVLATSVLLLRFAANGGRRPAGDGDPTLPILGTLAVMLGLPYLALATSTPLVQTWYARSRGSAMPYRLYAFSNAGSLAALLCYPVLVEPYLSLRSQTMAWSAGYVVYAVLAGALALAGYGQRAAVSPGLRTAESPATPPGWGRRLLWVALAGCASALLLASTNLLTEDVAPVPFLWILPLGLYLASFILCFAHGPWYSSRLFGWLVTPALFGLAFVMIYSRSGANLVLTATLLCGGLFVCCMFCHGELAKLRPEPAFLTRFYLMVALGGALGGALAALAAPHLFVEYFEFPITLALCACLAWTLTPRSTASLIRLGLTLALVGYVSELAYLPMQQARVAARNFYGTLKVIDSGEGPAAVRTLLHGGISHGSQWLAPDKRRLGTAYYGPASGGALAIRHLNGGARRVGVVGLGPGTMAAYGRAGDYYRFYELNPLVIRMAETQFTYLTDCPATVEVVEGDARLSLEREAGQRFDVLAIDAFSGDSIPVHLLTREAFEIYLRHLRPEGVLAIHVSNRFLDFTEVVAAIASSLGRESLAVLSPGSAQDRTLAATWVLASANREFLASPVFKPGGRKITPARRLRLWTDDYSNLFQVLR
ncbi:MAG: fused MFS/spermidine synthase [Bryobacterales bacterium]|nr:fused MFS/spermidine synthase [Bryobacterales bacterium]